MGAATKKKTPDAGQGIEGQDQNTYQENQTMSNATASIAQSTDTGHTLVTTKTMESPGGSSVVLQVCLCGVRFFGTPTEVYVMRTEHLAAAAQGVECLYPGCNGEEHYTDYELTRHIASSEEGEAWGIQVELAWNDPTWRVYGKLEDRQAYGSIPGLTLDDVDEFNAAYGRAHVLAAELNAKMMQEII